ncbi:restriction endonuclease subunit S [Rhodococcus sp. 008]|uniref:restriction endonuclease subunit S n=1 Tax=Rhodococcus sp. 008 TaxID=1723645 RepID=UPI0008062236|nr:restriction endonuclease subunit S [Rhodococcus sp. 008]ANQ74433.1 restriction endonuclease subunit S [Rhodococcus sp. 008]
MTSAALGWIDVVPKGWYLVPAKAAFTERREANWPDDVHLTPSQIHGVLSQAEYMAKTGKSVVQNIQGQDNMKHVEPDDFIIHLRSFQGGIERSTYSGKVSTAYTVLRPSDRVVPSYFRWLLKSNGYIQELRTTTNQLRDGQSIKFADFAKVQLPCPPHSEQHTIADYLDRETARIDMLVEEQQRLIELLRERRHAVRTHVALHGTTQVSEVQSPLPWASKLPASWRVVPLTSVAQLESGHTPSRSREDWWTDCYIPWVSLHDVGTMRGPKYLQDTAQRISDAGIANSSARLLPARTVVLSRDATVGRTAIMGVPMATSQHFAAWVCGPLLNPEYLWALFANAMQPFFDSFQNGSTIRTIGMGDLKAFRIPLPPIDEQRRIVEYLDEETPKIDTLIAEAERFIELARERRSALITAAVTGQIDIREMK